jgi:hypothetical protein
MGLLALTVSWIQAGNSPFDDSVLDGGGWTATGTIRDVEELTDDARRVHYDFEADGVELQGSSYAESGAASLRPGDSCTIEYLRKRPEINRMQGTSRARSLFDPTLRTVVTVLCSLGLLAAYIWIRGALALRIALRGGRLTTAQIIEAKVLRFVNPRPVRVHYRFQDALGMEHIATHYVGVRSKLGRRLVEESPRDVPVIHDEGDPALNRLVHPEDFLG